LPFGSGHLAAWLQRLTCPRQRAFAPGHQARYPASYTRPPAEEPSTLPCFPAAFRPPASAFWASFPAPGFRPPYGRPTTPPARRGPGRGFHVPHVWDPAGSGCPLYPGGGGVHTAGHSPRPPPAASQRPAPVTLDYDPPQGVSV